MIVRGRRETPLVRPGSKRVWRHVWGCYRFSLVIERKVAPIDTRPRMERIEGSLRSRFVDGLITAEEFESKLWRAMQREA